MKPDAKTGQSSTGLDDPQKRLSRMMRPTRKIQGLLILDFTGSKPNDAHDSL